MSFIFSWNQFLFSLILSGPKTKTVPGRIATVHHDRELNRKPRLVPAPALAFAIDMTERLHV